MLQHLSLFTHTALDIFEFGQDVQAETISLASGSVSTIHEVTKGQNQTKNPLHSLTVLQRLQRGQVYTSEIQSEGGEEKTQMKNDTECWQKYKNT